MSSVFAVVMQCLFIVNLLIKTDCTVICVSCMLEHICYEPFSLKIADLEDTLC